MLYFSELLEVLDDCSVGISRLSIVKVHWTSFVDSVIKGQIWAFVDGVMTETSEQ